MVPETDIATACAAILGSGWVVATNVFEGPVRPVSLPAIPHKAVFAAQAPSKPASLLMGMTNPDIRWESVQVTYRGDVGDYATARTNARALWDGLHGRTITGYISCLCKESAPLPLTAPDDGEHPIFTINLEVGYAG